MDDQSRQKHMQVIAEYQKLLEGWPLKPTIEERMAAFKEAQEMLPRARWAERCLLQETEPRNAEQMRQGVEAASEWLGVDSSQVWKWIVRKNAP
jgi:hypothetical protein